MTNRKIIDISEQSVFLRVQNKLLCIEPKEGEKHTVPIAEIGALIISNQAVALTAAVLSEISKAGGIVISCDSSFKPSGMLLPLAANTEQTERFRIQSEVAEPVKKQIWKDIVKSKVLNQSNLLNILNGQDCGLNKLAQTVKSGDTENIEAQAARRYWGALPIGIGDIESFIRDPFADDQNILLNYGYAVLRALVLRAICGSGLHPTLGVHHHNKYDPFCLADDLMEPFRPMIDYAVVRIVGKYGKEALLDRNTKPILINSILEGRVLLDDNKVLLSDAISILTASVIAVYSKSKEKILLPEKIFVS